MCRFFEGEGKGGGGNKEKEILVEKGGVEGEFGIRIY